VRDQLSVFTTGSQIAAPRKLSREPDIQSSG